MAVEVIITHIIKNIQIKMMIKRSQKSIKEKTFLIDSSVGSTKFLVEYSSTPHSKRVSETFERMRSFLILLAFVCGLVIENASTRYLLVEVESESPLVDQGK